MLSYTCGACAVAVAALLLLHVCVMADEAEAAAAGGGGSQADAEYFMPDEYDGLVSAEEKRSGLKPIYFPCNGYDHIPRCLHGGKGPRKTWSKSGQYCVCLCPAKWVGPECGYATDSLGKRGFPWKLIADEEEEKRGFPWKLIPDGKRNFPWKLMGGKRAFPWKLMGKQ